MYESFSMEFTYKKYVCENKHEQKTWHKVLQSPPYFFLDGWRNPQRSIWYGKSELKCKLHLCCACIKVEVYLQLQDYLKTFQMSLTCHWLWVLFRVLWVCTHFSLNCSHGLLLIVLQVPFPCRRIIHSLFTLNKRKKTKYLNVHPYDFICPQSHCLFHFTYQCVLLSILYFLGGVDN